MYRQPKPSPIEKSFWASAKAAVPELEREVWIGKYRVDFLVRSKKVIIELYGYQWHSTKEKLTQDATRERFLQRQGYRVVRFTGSEVYRDLQKCVRELVAFIRTLPEVALVDSGDRRTRQRSRTVEGGNPATIASAGTAVPMEDSGTSELERPWPESQGTARERGRVGFWESLKPWQRRVLITLLVLDVMFLCFVADLLLRSR